jgi:hypothetical protein
MPFATLSQSDGSTIYDLVMRAYGSLNYTYKFIKDNPSITSLDLDLKTVPGQAYIYDTLFIQNIPPDVKPNPKVVITNRTIMAHEGQSLFDLCIMTYGTLGLMYKLISDNPSIDNLNKATLSQLVLSYDTNFIIDKLYWKGIVANNLIINTGITPATTSQGVIVGRAYSTAYSIGYS